MTLGGLTTDVISDIKQGQMAVCVWIIYVRAWS